MASPEHRKISPLCLCVLPSCLPHQDHQESAPFPSRPCGRHNRRTLSAKPYTKGLWKKTVIFNSNTYIGLMRDLIYRVVTLPHKTLYQLYIPASLRKQLLEYFHHDPLSAHLGRHKTYRRLQSLVYWLKLSWDTREHVQKCQVCQTHKPENRKLAGKLQWTIGWIDGWMD